MVEKEYIDREILLKKNFYTENCNSEENRWNDYAIKDIIMHIPAADVAPVKHGHWIEFQGGFFTKHMRCSVCNNTLDPNGVNAGRGDMNYCPNCGADMRGE